MNRSLTFAIALVVTAASVGTAAAAKIKLTAMGHTIELPCGPIEDQTGLTCQEACDEMNDPDNGITCEVIDGVAYVTSDEFPSVLELVDDAKQSAPDNDRPRTYIIKRR